MNVAEFALRVTGAIGIDAATANSATSSEYALFLSWLNESRVQFLRRTKIFKITAALSVTAGVGDYTIDSEILAFEDAIYDPASGTGRALRLVDSLDISEARQISESGTDPYCIAYEGQQIFLYPAPQSSSDQLHIKYVPRPASALAATADTPATTAYGGIPEEYHHVLEAYVKWKAAEHTNDKASGNGREFQEQWEQGLVEAKIAESRKAGLTRGSVRIGRGADWRLAAGPGVDLGV